MALLNTGDNAKNKPIVLVSGLPRSGTSMMMRMLQAGGMELMVDHIRKADEDNPHGYFEYERVKRLDKDTAWLKEARGKAVKVISQLLYHLPVHQDDFEYRILFMQRQMEEILASQRAMLIRRGQPADDQDDDILADKFSLHLKKITAWLTRQEKIKTLYIKFHHVIASPHEASREINRFLGNVLNINQMTRAVDRSLYRQRSA